MRLPGSVGAGAVLAVAAAAMLVVLASGGAIAGDNVALFSFEPDEIEAVPGEEVTVEIVMASYGGYGGEGIAAVSFALDYDPETLSVTDLEAEPWLEGEDGAEVAVEEEVDEEAGEAWLNQSREPAGDGATGTAPIATATLEVSEDAEPANATLSITGSSVTLATDDPQSTMVRDAVVIVDGGEPADEGDEEAEGTDPDGVTLADDAEPDDADVDATDGGDDSEAEDEDDEPSMTALATVGAIAFVAVVGLAAIALRRRDPGV